MKKFRNLSLVLAGFALGVAVAYSPQIQAAASSLLGSKVGNVLDVKIDNKSIGKGAVINGTTYVPLRSAANAMGMEITKVDSKEVNLVSDTEPTPPTTPIVDNSDQIRLKVEELNGKISEIKMKITYAEDVISNKESTLNAIQRNKEMLEILDKQKAAGSELYNEANYQMYQKQIEKSQNNLDNAERDLPILKQQLADLEKQKQELEAQLK